MSIVVSCPHCNELILIYLAELNCRIFRHGVFKKSFVQIDPHTSKRECDLYVSKGLILGCGKPFLIDASLNAGVCGYI